MQDTPFLSWKVAGLLLALLVILATALVKPFGVSTQLYSMSLMPLDRDTVQCNPVSVGRQSFERPLRMTSASPSPIPPMVMFFEGTFGSIRWQIILRGTQG